MSGRFCWIAIRAWGVSGQAFRAMKAAGQQVERRAEGIAWASCSPGEVGIILSGSAHLARPIVRSRNSSLLRDHTFSSKGLRITAAWAVHVAQVTVLPQQAEDLDVFCWRMRSLLPTLAYWTSTQASLLPHRRPPRCMLQASLLLSPSTDPIHAAPCPWEIPPHLIEVWASPPLGLTAEAPTSSPPSANNASKPALRAMITLEWRTALKGAHWGCSLKQANNLNSSIARKEWKGRHTSIRELQDTQPPPLPGLALLRSRPPVQPASARRLRPRGW